MTNETTSSVVLVVDDSPDTLRMLTDALDAASMTVMVALDGVSAMRIVERIIPDMILLDAVMPGLDGFETCRRLKRDPRLADVPVIFMTGLTETEHIVRGLEAGGVDYVTKPIVVAEMLARIKVHLANARLTQSARAALDVSGRYLFAVDRNGEVLWSTPQAQKLLASETPSGVVGVASPLPAVWLRWLQQIASGRAGADAIPPSAAYRGGFQLQYLGMFRTNEFLLQLTPEAVAETTTDFSKKFGLTPREGEVLSWLSKGKTNRDIAQILGLSPRTVDKHLEQIYAKLGVENRTAAVAFAADAHQRRG
jgi:DNA-binding NarL/FixJ family response regulator